MNKYKAKKTDGYASKKEATRAVELKLLARAGTITDLREQVKYILIYPTKRSDGQTERECAYIADFTYRLNGALVVEDVKGFRTPVYILKRKLMLLVNDIEITEI